MWKHYITVALRNFRKNLIVFLGSVITLSLGTLCVSLLFAYVNNEFSMDDFHKRKQDIHMVVVQQTPASVQRVFNLNAFAKFDPIAYPEIESLVSVTKYEHGELRFSSGDIATSPEGIIADSSFFKVFDFKLKIGDREEVLTNPDAVVITEQLAKILFDDQEPLGKVIEVKSQSTKKFVVSGILEKIPPNSSISFDFVIPSQADYVLFSKMGGDFILFNKKFDKPAFNSKIAYLAREHFQFTESTLSVLAFDQEQLRKDGLISNAIISHFVDQKSLRNQLFIILIIILVSVLNFSNLQTINTNTRIKNSALKQINGANKKQILEQLFVEVVLLMTISAIVVSLAFEIILPSFNTLIGATLAPPIWQLIGTNVLVISLICLVGLIYPAITIQRASILNGLKNQSFTGKTGSGRKIIVVLQYSLTFLLLISSIIIYRQLQFMLHKDLGFKQENIVTTKIFEARPYGMNEKEKVNFEESFQFVKNEIKAQTSIKSFSQGNKPIDFYSMNWRRKDGVYKYETQNTLTTTPSYENLLGLEVLEGRFFDAQKENSRDRKIVINESAKKYWGISNIIGKRLMNKSWDSEKGLGWEIIGVVKDFNYEHLSVNTQPLIMVYMEDYEDTFLIEFEQGAAQTGLIFMEKLFKNLNPKSSFTYSFLSEDIKNLYKKEKQVGFNYIMFTIVSLIISIIGLFTIVLYDTKRRIKEIAIRKVNGAKAVEILVLLNKGFAKCVLIAFFIACPVTYYLMDKWLENFVYTITISWWVFVLAGLSTLTIAILTITWQSYKAARTNPGNSLRTE